MADPIHGIIEFDRGDDTHRLLLDVVNCKAFQRLRHIKQMGLAEFVFPGATHSRFVHSLGATHLMIQAINHLNKTETSREYLASTYRDTDIPLSRLLLLGILVHDIGHTPLSHTLEDVLELKEQKLLHDVYWNRKILTEDPELQLVWEKHGPGLPTAVCEFMEGDEKTGVAKHFLAQLVSSQLDMDRLDYLQRDSHFLGVQYGRIEADRIISNMVLRTLPDDTPIVAIREEATPAIEHYLFGRHQAYKMALHALDKASEALLKLTLMRFKWVRENNINTGNPANELYLLMTNGKKLTTAQFLRMDDCYLWEAIQSWESESSDPLLQTLASRLKRHDLCKFVDLAKYGLNGDARSQALLEPVRAALKAHYKERGLSFEFGFDENVVSPKPLYQRPPNKEPIWVQSSRNRVRDLSEVSSLPLEVVPDRGLKYLWFVWDKHVKNYLTELLEAHFPRVDSDASDDEETYYSLSAD